MRPVASATASAFQRASFVGLAPAAQARTSGHACILGLAMVNQQVWWTGAATASA